MAMHVQHHEVLSGDDATESTSTRTSPLSRRPRKQVSRACDLCRARRTRCDNGQPCKVCSQRGVECTYKGDNEPRTLSMALREIDRLKGHVRDLEDELAVYKSKAQGPPSLAMSVPTPESVASSRLQPSCAGSGSPPSPSGLMPAVAASYQKPQWKGVYVCSAGARQAVYYGPASSFFFVRRMGCFLGRTLDQPCADQRYHPWARSAESRIANTHTAEAVEAGSTITRTANTTSHTTTSNSPQAAHGMADLSRVQEEALLRLFWDGYHCLLPVVDADDFRAHYASLWEDSESSPRRHERKDSPLVDVILALCLQYSCAFIPQRQDHDAASPENASTVGRWHYRRAQSLLAASLESPSLVTVQCYVFMMVYLCCASFHNMCHIMAAQAIRTAQVLGLHLEPPLDLPAPDKELRRRIWWTLWIFDAKTSLKLGRPLTTGLAQSTVAPPSELAAASPSSNGSNGSSSDVTWLSYIAQQTKLYLVVVAVSDAMGAKFGEAIERSGRASIYQDPQDLESCAVALAEWLPSIKAWVDALPPPLKTRRRNDGRPFSTDRAALDIDDLAPTWLTRQSVGLELAYHTLMIFLTRPFITFYQSQSPSQSQDAATYTHMTERHATTCVEHAITYTLLAHQAVTETDLFSGWSEYFALQWNAAITIIGFMLAYPIHPATPRARHALDKAMAVFDHFGETFGVSRDAAAITRDLAQKADDIGARLSRGMASPRPAVDAGADCAGEDGGQGAGAVPPVVDAVPLEDDFTWLDPSQQGDFGQFGPLMDWALSVDSSTNFDKFFDFGSPTYS